MKLPTCRRPSCGHVNVLHIGTDNDGACIRLGCSCPAFERINMKVVVTMLLLTAAAAAALFFNACGAL